MKVAGRVDQRRNSHEILAALCEIVHVLIEGALTQLLVVFSPHDRRDIVATRQLDP